jgi:NitT/TauT family transport system permease protein
MIARWAWRILVIVVLLAAWEAYGEFVDDTWTSRPLLVALRLRDWGAGMLLRNTAVTISEIFFGLLIGVPAGSLVGIGLGRLPALSRLLRPLLLAANSVPVVALAPLLIMWFGLGQAPKIALVALVSFFLLFFNAYAGVQAIDEDLVDMLRLMGATGDEIFFKAVLPGSTIWLFAGLRVALPYALIAATVGEMMLARDGLGFLITDAAGQFDMTGVFAALAVLMALGVVIAEVAARCESWVLRWRA